MRTHNITNIRTKGDARLNLHIQGNGDYLVCIGQMPAGMLIFDASDATYTPESPDESLHAEYKSSSPVLAAANGYDAKLFSGVIGSNRVAI